MQTVNAYYLYHALGQLNAMTDTEYEQALDTWDGSYQEFLARHLMPSYALWDAESQTKVFNALRYALATGRVDFAAVLAEQWYSPMPTPENAREVFEALWQLLAPGCSYHAAGIAAWQERNVREEAVIRGRRETSSQAPRAV